MTHRQRKKANAAKGRGWTDLCSGQKIEIKVRPFPEGHRAIVYADGKPLRYTEHTTKVRTKLDVFQTYLPNVLSQTMRWYDKMGGCVPYFSERRGREREIRKGRETAF